MMKKLTILLFSVCVLCSLGISNAVINKTLVPNRIENFVLPQNETLNLRIENQNNKKIKTVTIKTRNQIDVLNIRNARFVMSRDGIKITVENKRLPASILVRNSNNANINVELSSIVKKSKAKKVGEFSILAIEKTTAAVWAATVVIVPFVVKTAWKTVKYITPRLFRLTKYTVKKTYSNGKYYANRAYKAVRNYDRNAYQLRAQS